MKEQIKLQTKGASIEAPKEKAARERFIYNSWRDVFRAHSNGYERVADIINPLNKPEVHTMLGESLGEDTVKEILQKLKDECTSI